MTYRPLRNILAVGLALLTLASPAMAEVVSPYTTPIVGVGVDLFNFDDTPVVTATPEATATPEPTVASEANGLFNMETDASTTNATAEFFGVDPDTLGDTVFEPVDGSVSFSDPEEPMDTGTFEGASISGDPFGLNSATLINEFGVTSGTAVSDGYSYSTFDGTPAQTTTTNSTMFVSASALNILKEPQDSASVMTTVYFGQKLNVVITQGDWAGIENGSGVRGYCHLSALSSSNPDTMSKTMYTQLAKTPLYSKPHQKANKLRTYGQNEAVTVTAITSDGMWSHVRDANGQEGFIPTIELDDAQVAQGVQAWCYSASTPVVVNPDRWTQITTLSFGQECYVVSYLNNNTVAKIRTSAGYVAYCAASALTNTDPVTMSLPVYVQVAGKLLYTTAEDNSTSIEIPKNTALTLLGVDSSQTWALVRSSKNNLFYIPYIFLGEAKAQKDSYKVVVATGATQIYKSTSTGSDVTGSVQEGTRMYLIGYSTNGIGALVRIIADNATSEGEGYIPLKYLRNE